MDAPDDDNGGHLSPGQMEKLVQLQVKDKLIILLEELFLRVCQPY